MADDIPTPSDSSSPIAEIEHGPSKFEQFLDRNHKKLLLGASVLVIAVASTYLYTEIKRSHEEDAGESLVSALSQENPAEAAVQLEKVIAADSGARAATTAELFLAQAKWRAGDQDAAISQLESFIQSHPEHPELGSAMLKLANFQLQSGKTDEAKETFEAIINNPKASFAAPHALLTLGDLAASEGDNAAAKAYYERIRDDFAASRTATLSGGGQLNIIDERLEILDIQPPTPYVPERKLPELNRPIPPMGDPGAQPMPLPPIPELKPKKDEPEVVPPAPAPEADKEAAPEEAPEPAAEEQAED